VYCLQSFEDSGATPNRCAQAGNQQQLHCCCYEGLDVNMSSLEEGTEDESFEIEELPDTEDLDDASVLESEFDAGTQYVTAVMAWSAPVVHC